MSPRTLIVSLHDMNRHSVESIKYQIRRLAEWGVKKTSILVIPQYHHDTHTIDRCNPCGDLLRQWPKEGHELVLHGYYHDRYDQRLNLRTSFWTRLYTGNEAEFLDLSLDEAKARLQKGLELFKTNGWAVSGFIAPGWLMPRGCEKLLGEMGFLYTNTLRELIPLRKNVARIQSQSLCYSTRANWRQIVSVGWNRTLFKNVKNNPLLRLSLHPNDFRYPAIQTQVEHFVKTALHSGFTPSTYADFVQAL